MAGQKYLSTARRLQRAVNAKFNLKILINANQWYSEEKKCVINTYTVKQVLDNDKNRRNIVELFKTYSTVQLALFMRDYWYELNGWDVPTDNPVWEEVKKKYDRSGEVTSIDPTIRGKETHFEY